MTNSVKSQLERLQGQPFPDLAESDQLANWQADLAELDGHIVGIAITVEDGGWAEAHTLSGELAKLQEQLKLLDDLPAEDRKIYSDCQTYVERLAAVVEALDRR